MEKLEKATAITAIKKPEQVAWGGIGGSGSHAAEAMAEIARNPDALTQIAGKPEVLEMLEKLPQKAWGGIGGSGAHADDLAAEIVK